MPWECSGARSGAGSLQEVDGANLRIRIEPATGNVGVSVHNFVAPLNDLGDVVILFFRWEIRIYFPGNPYGTKQRASTRDLRPR